jgi:uncharacterized protein
VNGLAWAVCTKIRFHVLYIQISHYECAVEFSWDARKNRLNRRKHRISFETAILVFDDPNHISIQDREVDGEARWQTIGMVGGAHVLLVAHTVDEEAQLIRILSARKATRRERGIYGQSFYGQGY